MAIKLEQVNVNLGGRQVLENFCLELPESGLVCLSGPSGCGKTTLLHLLAGLITPQSGALRGLEHKRVSMLFQEDRLLPWLTAAGNVALVLPAHKPPQPWLELVELAEEAHKMPLTLSGGMRRRLSLARALAFDGELLLLDEPTNGLDEELAQRVLLRIKDYYAARLVIMVTHDRDFAVSQADLLLMLDGPPLRLL